MLLTYLLNHMPVFFMGSCTSFIPIFKFSLQMTFQGVLIVGDRGTGKTSLALAIAAEARVPVVKIKAQELEGDLWVGQSAGNVRELFQTARDLVIFIYLLIFPFQTSITCKQWFQLL